MTVFDPAGYTGSGPIEPTTLTTYDARGLATRVEHPNGTRSRSTYDTRGRLVAVIVDVDGDGAFEPAFDGDDAVGATHYDLVGRALRVVGSLGNETVSAYDRAGRVTEVRGALVDDAENGGTAEPVTSTAYRRRRIPGRIPRTDSRDGFQTPTLSPGTHVGWWRIPDTHPLVLARHRVWTA